MDRSTFADSGPSKVTPGSCMHSVRLNLVHRRGVQQLINHEDANPCPQTEEIDAKDFQRAVILKAVLARREHRQNAGHNQETEDYSSA